MHRALLVTDEEVTDYHLRDQRVVNGKFGAAGLAEQVLLALVGERREHHFRAGHFSGRCRFLRHRRLPSLSSLAALVRPIKKAREGPCSDTHSKNREGYP